MKDDKVNDPAWPLGEIRPVPFVQAVYKDFEAKKFDPTTVKLPENDIKTGKSKKQKKTMKLRFVRWAGPVKVYQVLVRKWFFFWGPLNRDKP